MAFKINNPVSQIANTKSHGTNANFKKSGAPLMKNLGKMAGNFIKGKGPLGFMNPIGMAANKLGAFGKGDQNQVQNQNAVAQNTVEQNTPTPPPTASAPVPTPEEQGVTGPMTMKKKAGATMKKKAGAPMLKAKTAKKVLQKPRPVPKVPSKPKYKKVDDDNKFKIKKGAPMKKSPMEKGGDGCGGNFKVNKPGTVVSRALKRAGGSVKRGLDNVVVNIKEGNKKRKKKRNTVKEPKNTGRGGHIVRSSNSYN